MSRVLGVDPGQARIGVAMSDPTGAVAQPHDVVARTGCAGVVAGLVAEHAVTLVVVGLPVSLDGTEGPSAAAARELADELVSVLDVPVELWDERLSTVQAERTMRSGGADSRRQRGQIDKVAAAIILQSYLDAHR